MDKFEAQRVMSGTQGEIWIEGKYMAEVTGFKAEIKLIKEEVNQLTYSPCLKAGDSWIQTILAY